MQLKVTPIVAGLCMLGLVTVPAFAADTSSNNPNEQQLIEKLSQQTTELQKEVVSLQKQVKTLKTQHTVAHVAKSQEAPIKKVSTGPSVIPAQSIYENLQLQKHTIMGKRSEQPTPVYSLNSDPIFISGNPITTAPYLGEHTAFDASDLVVYFTNVGIDLRLLQQREKIYGIYKQYGLETPRDPMLNISGGLEAQYVNQKPYTGNKVSDVDLTRGELDLTANINTWTTGFMTFAYDNAPPVTPMTGERVSNARLFLDKGFVTIGNLSQTPFYSTIGQFYVPFGSYVSYMVSDSLPKMMARIKDRALELGFDRAWNASEINATVFTFKGDSSTSASSSKLNQLGANLDYDITQPKWNATVGGSVISNMADSLGMQNNGGSNSTVNFAGFDNSSEQLVRRVPAYDLHGSVGVGHYTAIAEYVEAFHDFSPANMTYNGHGADPGALNIEGIYSFPVYNLPSSIAIGYGMTKDALALLLPKQRYIATYNISIWKDTVESLEFRHDINYPGSATATGQTLAVSSSGLGHASDTLTFQIGVYF